MKKFGYLVLDVTGRQKEKRNMNVFEY